MTVPPTTAQVGSQVLPYNGDLASVEKRLRTERKLMLLPVTGGAVTVWAGSGLHEQMLAALAVGGPEMLAIGIGGSAAVATVSTVVLLAAAARTGTGDALPHVDGHVKGQKLLAVRRLLAGSAGAGVALAVFGGHPLIVGGYLVAALMSTGRWHLERFRSLRVLKSARAEISQAAVPARGESQPTAEAEAVAPVAPVAPAEIAEIVERWRVGVAPKHLPGTWLTNGQVHDEGRMSFVVNSGPSGTTLAAAQSVLEKLPAALRLALPAPDGGGGQDIVFDQPTTGELADRSQLRVQIINRSSRAVRGSRVTPELVVSPTNPGAAHIGGYVDDASNTWWDFASDSGAHSGFVLAGTRQGKSSLFDNLAYRARQMGYLIAFLDPQRGASSPVLAQHADFPVLGAEHTPEFHAWLEAEADLRESWMGAHGLGKITPWTQAPCRPGGERPDPDCPCGGVVPPGIMAFVDECDQVFRQTLPGTTTTRWGGPFGEQAKRINKLNMGLVTASQVPEQAIFGGSELLRSSLSTRNFLAMRVNANSGAGLIPGLPFNPSLLPRTPGRALMCGAESRQMEAQLDFMPRREDAAKHAGPYAEDLFERLPRARQWAPTTAAARRLLPAQGEDTAGVSRQAARKRLARLMSGGHAEPRVSIAETVPAVSTGPVPAAGGSMIAWPAAVGGPVAVAERPATAGTLSERLLRALDGLPDDRWVTMGDLAKRLGRVAEDADTPEVKVAAASLVADLAVEDVMLPGRRRTAGMSATVGQIRAVLQ
jgi:hypothetical protein